MSTLLFPQSPPVDDASLARAAHDVAALSPADDDGATTSKTSRVTLEDTLSHIGAQAGALVDRTTTVLCLTSVTGTRLGDVRERAADVAASSGDLAERSRAAAGATAEIRTLVEGARAAVEALGSHARDIERVSASLTRLALETRFVGLNAAIEAARAGAAGAGFGVVAEKVRELADGANSAADEIVTRLAAIRDRAVRSAAVMERVGEQVGAIDRFTAAVADAATVQEHGTAEITTGLIDVEASLAEITSATEQITEVGMTLSEDAERGAAAVRELASVGGRTEPAAPSGVAEATPMEADA